MRTLKTIILSIVISTSYYVVSFASNTTADLISIYNNYGANPKNSDWSELDSDIKEYNKLLDKEKQITEYNNSVEIATNNQQQVVDQAQYQVQELLTKAANTSMYIEDNIFGNYSELVKKDAEYKQCYRAASKLLDKVNKTQLPPMLLSIEEDINSKKDEIDKKKIKTINSSNVSSVVIDDGFVLGDLYGIKTITDVDYELLSDYGSRINPATNSSVEYHNGIDIKAPYGTNVYSMFNGQVIEVGDGWSLGKFVRIKHGSGIITVYAHLSSFNVRNGQIVNQFDVIGKSGNSGANVTDDYLYLSLFINGRSVNPKILFQK